MNEQRSSPKPSAIFPSPIETFHFALGFIGAPAVPPKPQAPLALLVLALSLAIGCARPDVCDPIKNEICHDCFGDMYTCTYDGISVTTRACEGCQARYALRAELCALGRTDNRAEVEASMVCEVVDTGAR